jgi:phage-related protein (TIGR01555 family)
MKAAFDGFYDPTTGRGGRNDRTQRTVGNPTTYTDLELYEKYASNGMLQRVINAPADDATREWFELESANKKQVERTMERLEELGAQMKFREVFKYAGIYPNGASMFIGAKTRDVEDMLMLAKPMPDEVLKVEFLNLVTDPNDLQVEVSQQRNATLPGYKDIEFRINWERVHKSRVLWQANEFNTETGRGISKVQTVFDAISAQDSALWSISSLMQVLSLLVFKSKKFLALKKDAQTDFLKKLRVWADTQASIGMGDDEMLERLNADIPGLKDILDFIFQNISGSSQMPVSVLLGRMQGVLVAGEEDLINWYNAIAKFQKLQMEPMLRHLIDIIAREREGGSSEKFDYEIKFNKLWELSPTLQADVDKKNADRDSVDILDGKITPDEARELDERLDVLDPLEGGEELTAEPEDESPAGVEDSASVEVDGKAVPASKIALDRANVGRRFVRIQVRAPRAFNENSFRVIHRSTKKGILSVDGKPKSGGPRQPQVFLFEKSTWDHKGAEAWMRSRIVADALTPEASVTKELLPWDVFDSNVPMKIVELDLDKGISAWEGPLLDSGETAFQSISFRGDAWTAEKVDTWIDLDLPAIGGASAKLEASKKRRAERKATSIT